MFYDLYFAVISVNTGYFTNYENLSGGAPSLTHTVHLTYMHQAVKYDLFVPCTATSTQISLKAQS